MTLNRKRFLPFLFLVIFSFSFIQPVKAVTSSQQFQDNPPDPPFVPEPLPYYSPSSSNDNQEHSPIASDPIVQEDQVIAAGAFTSCASVTQIPESECNALVALYNSTNGSSWTTNTNWLQTDAPCDWYGVSCYQSHVSFLNLSQNQLSGNVPPELGVLQNLEYLSFNSNQLTGSIPSELGNLQNLTDLRFFSNQLTGTIPVEITGLQNLERLELTYNQLSGNIPPQIGNLTSLQELYLSFNQFEGSIPPEIGSLSNLERLWVNANLISGDIPTELGNLSNLTWLELRDNSLSGNIPPELGNLTNLLYLELDNNQLSGSIPTELGNLPNLKYLYLHDNQLSGSIPPELGDLTASQRLSLSANQLSGTLPPEIGNLLNLQTLALHENQLTGNIPPEIGNLINLESCWMNYNDFTGSIPVQIGNLANLQNLSFYQNRLSGAIPPEIGNLTNLGQLVLAWNQLSGEVPFEITYLTQLTFLDINYNNLSSSNPTVIAFLNEKDSGWAATQQELPFTSCATVSGIPQSECEALVTLYNTTNGSNWRDNTNWLQSNTPCEWFGISCSNGHVSHLGLMNNNLSGPIPAQLTDLTELGYLGLYNNHLTGEIPPQLGSMTEVFAFYLYGNELTGSIPEELGDLPIVRWIDLSNNQLSGEIPAALGNFGAYFQILDLSNNNLTGSIPTSLGDLPIDTLWIYLNDNQLSGAIPDSLGNITELEILDLSNNQLSGEIPASIGNFTVIETLKLQHNELSREVPATIVNLNTLTSLDIGYNHLYSSNPTVIAFLNAKDPDWADTQIKLPPKVDDLKTLFKPNEKLGKIVLKWTAPDFNVPGSSKYDSYVIKYHDQSVSEAGGEEAWWNSANDLPGEPKPGSIGVQDEIIITGLPVGDKHYFVIRTKNSSGDLSGFSNVPSLYDTGFRPNPNGYKFENQSKLGVLDIEDMRKLFGDDAVCQIVSNDYCMPRTIPRLWQIAKNLEMLGGHCYGMAATSANFYSGADDPSTFGSDETWYLDPSKKVWQNIDTYHVVQSVEPINSLRIQSRLDDSLTDILNKIYASSDPLNLGIYHENEDGRRAGHAITPYAIEQVEEDYYRIWIYDNNHPYEEEDTSDSEAFIKLSYVTEDQGLWSYNNLSWIGESDLIRVNENPEPLQTGEYYDAPWGATQESIALSANAESQLLITNSLGQKIGYENGVFINEIPNAYENIPELGSETSLSNFQLPTNDTYTITLDGTDLTEAEVASLTQFGPGFAISVDALSVSPGGESQIAVAADGSQIELLAGENQSEAALSLALDGTEHSTSFSVTGAEVGSGAAVSLSANADTGMMVYENGSGASGNYQPRVTLVGKNGYQFFVNRSVEIPPNAAHAYDTASWFGPEAMTVQMDQNGDGTFETTTQVENDASYLFFPLVIEKRPDLLEKSEPEASEFQQAGTAAESSALQALAPTAEPTENASATPTARPTTTQTKPTATATESPVQPVFQTNLGDYQLTVMSVDSAAPEQFKAELRGDSIILENSGPDAAFILEVASQQTPAARHTLKIKTGEVYTLRLSGQGPPHALRIEQQDGTTESIPLSDNMTRAIPASTIIIILGVLAGLLLTAWLIFKQK